MSNLFTPKSPTAFDSNTPSAAGLSTPQPIPLIVQSTNTPHNAGHPALSTHATPYMPMSSNAVSGVIGPCMTITGDIEFEGELMVQGRVTGNIRSKPDSKSVLRIDDKAEVNGDVDVPVIKVAGLLKGTVSCSELLHLQATGAIEGPIKYNNLQLDGGSLTGSLTPEFKNGKK